MVGTRSRVQSYLISIKINLQEQKPAYRIQQRAFFVLTRKKLFQQCKFHKRRSEVAAGKEVRC